MNDQLGPVHHVANLDAAIALWADAYAAGQLLPCFTTTLAEWPDVVDAMKRSYTIEFDRNGVTHRVQAVVLYVRVLDNKPSSTV